MATADSVKTKLQGLIAKANEATGNTDVDLTTAVNALVAGFGQGGGGLPAGITEIKTGSWTQATNDATGSFTIPHGCSKTPRFIIVNSDYATSGATVSNSVQLSAAIITDTGVAGTCLYDGTMLGGNNITCDNTNITFINYTPRRWRQGNTYTWYAICVDNWEG